MAIYSVSQTRAGINSANSAMWNLWAPTRPLFIREVGVSIAVAPSTAPVWALARATARGTQSTEVTPLAHDPQAVAATARFDSAWSVQPTFANTAPWIRALGMPVTAGGALIWTFPAPITIAAGTGLLIFNIAASGATLGTMYAYAEYDE